MDRGEPSPTRRKPKFTPKAPPNRKPKLPPSNIIEAGDEQVGDDADAKAFLRRWKDRAEKREPKESKSSVQVAFGPVESSSPPLPTYGVRKDSGKIIGSASKDFSTEQSALTRSSIAIEDKSDTCMIYAAEETTTAAPVNKRDYKEPWDYQQSYYPTTLPLRKPNSGAPETLDMEEFGEAATRKEYNENTVKPATELGLSEKSEQPRMLFFKFPLALPLTKQPVSKKGKEKVGASTGPRESTKGTPLEGLPPGYMGKMLVYKKGSVKLKLGEVVFNVFPGSNTTHAQDAVAMNTTEKHCCVLGALGKTAVVYPDLDSL